MTAEASMGVIPTWTLPDQIRKAREHAGFSQQELADRLSVTRQSIVNWERGHTRPLRVIIYALADETGVDRNWFDWSIQANRDDITTIISSPGRPPSVTDVKALAKRIPLTPVRINHDGTRVMRP